MKGVTSHDGTTMAFDRAVLRTSGHSLRDRPHPALGRPGGV